MKFGKPTVEELNHLDFELPQDHPDNKNILSGLKNESPEIYVGCAKWGRREWVGKLYPEKTKEKDFLDNYVNHFNSIELNATFYNAKKANMEKWAQRASEGFKFCPKVTRLITHIKRLNNAEEIADYYFEAIQCFGDSLGISFLQLPENFGPKKFEVFQSFIEYLPNPTPVCIEFRHADWFGDPVVFDETFNLLVENNIGSVITDVALRRDCVHQRLTTTTAFIRFNGYDLHPTDNPRMNAWVDRLENWINNGIEKIYFFMHQEDEANTPVSADYIISKLNDKLGLNIKRPAFNS